MVIGNWLTYTFKINEMANSKIILEDNVLKESIKRTIFPHKQLIIRVKFWRCDWIGCHISF